MFDAQNIAEKKAVYEWRSEPLFAKMILIDFGLPPYHFRCRTELVPVWINEEMVDGVKMKNTSPLDKDEVVRHIDKLGVERVLDSLALNGKHNLKTRLEYGAVTKQGIIKALNSINKLAPNMRDNRLTNAISDNGYFMVFDGDRIVTAFKPTSKTYFSDNSITLKQEVIKNYIFRRWF